MVSKATPNVTMRDYEWSYGQLRVDHWLHRMVSEATPLPTSQVVNLIPYIVNGNDNISIEDNVALDQY